MKITNKLAAIASAAVLALSFTGCELLGELTETIGKDDFRGTWVADYVDGKGRQVAVVNIFDGKSENLATEGVFVQSKIRFNTNNLNTAVTAAGEDSELLEGALAGKAPNMRNFYYGTYELHDNSNYTAGRLSLTYKYGIQWDGGEEVDVYFYGEDGKKIADKGYKTYTISQLTDIAFNKKGDGVGLTLANANDEASYKSGEEFFKAHFLASSTEQNVGVNTNPNVTVTCGTNPGSKTELCADIEHFSFALADATTTGYSSMIATEWWSVDQIHFSKYASKDATSESDGWYYNYNPINGDTKILANEFGGGTRDVTFMAPKSSTKRGSVKKHGDGPFDKKYWSAAMCDWEIPQGATSAERTYAQITTKVDMAAAIKFVEGKAKDKKGRVINYVVDQATKDETTDAWDADGDADDYSIRSAAPEAVEYAAPALLNTVGERVEK